MIYLIAFTFGLIWGSFFNVYVSRRIAGESLLWPPSHCDNCGRKLYGWQLVPVLGYVFQQGKCRFCGSTIPLEYTVFEMIHGVMAVLLFLYYPIAEGLLYFFSISVLVAMARIDYTSGEVYLQDLVILCLLFVLQGIMKEVSWVKMAVFISLFLLSFFTLQKEKYIGTGDISIFILIGMNMTLLEGFGFFLLFSILGGIVGLFLLMTGRDRKDEIPLVPIITAAYILYLPLNIPIYYFLGWGL
ncbi:prepilin peptidase [Gallicola sp. Sow4_E12]|uniref:prepilin peptidase n=1 Tax=Gallicola sp. Sow4_E12 TaxID=3438785 RepID=UPI003F926311